MASHLRRVVPSQLLCITQVKGIGMGEMVSKLLAKVEELTLHMIQAEERSARLE
jgi:hypothetical protein